MTRIKLAALTSALFLSASLFAYSASAQYQDDEADSGAPTGGSVARLQVRINELEEQVRRLQGSLEQVNFANKQIRGQMDKMKADTDYRLSALEKTGGAPTASSPAPAPQPQVENQSVSEQPGEHDLTTETHATEPRASAQRTQNNADAQPEQVQNYASSHEHYSAAFKLLNQAQYAQAGAVFSAFTQRYPKDPLIGNAYYWLGETYYVRKDYVKAADNFRQGYQSMPAGPKAGDNLLKLAMALGAQGKDKESCVVLKQTSSKFGKSSSGLKSRVEEEMNRIDCR